MPPDRKSNAPPRLGSNGRMSPDEAERICAQHEDLIIGVISWKKWNFDFHTQDDVAQMVRLDALKSLPEVDAPVRTEYFIKRIAIRRCIDEVRRQIRSRKLLVFPSPPDGEEGRSSWTGPEMVAGEEFDPVHCVLLMERAKLLQEALKQLDEGCASTIDKFYFKSIPYKEIAEKFGISINTVASRLSRCMDKLKQILTKTGNTREDFSPLQRLKG